MYLVAGLIDWIGDRLPTSEDAGHPVFDQGLTGVKAIAATGREILGNVALPVDFKVAPNFRDYSVGSVHSVWGMNVLPRLVEEHFLKA